jgi:pyruvate/2-oxoglutarate dehydrogenase complex dihydrolipoamide acyltransferase (E2) component
VSAIGSISAVRPEPDAEVVPFPRSRRFVVDIGRATRSRRTVNGFLDTDVTVARHRLRNHGAEASGGLSLTAYIACCIGRAVAADPQVHALRDLRGRLVVFDDVDINVSVEVELEGRSFPMNHVIRGADRRTVLDISDEINRIKHDPGQSPTSRLARGARWFLLAPGMVRVMAFRLLYRLPRRQKALVGTVGLTAVGMFGRGGGWGTAFQVHPLEVIVGGIAVRPGFSDGAVTPREYLHLTFAFDHDVVDGAPAARFASRVRELIEDPDRVLSATTGSDEQTVPDPQ